MGLSFSKFFNQFYEALCHKSPNHANSLVYRSILCMQLILQYVECMSENEMYRSEQLQSCFREYHVRHDMQTHQGCPLICNTHKSLEVTHSERENREVGVGYKSKSSNTGPFAAALERMFTVCY